MIKLITGKRGSGKTKILVNNIKEAVANTKGNVVCIEKSMQLTYDIPSSVRLVDVDGYKIDSFDKFYGFITGIIAGNYDITDIFVDATLKICNYDMAGADSVISRVKKLAETYGFRVVMTVSARPEDCTAEMRALV